VNGEFTIHCLTPLSADLLSESADVRGLTNDDVLDGVKQLRACGVRGQIDSLAERVELEDVMMVAGAGRRARAEIGSAADSCRSTDRTLRDASKLRAHSMVQIVGST